jgi:phosphatidylglycerophosphate synthase
LIAASRWGKYKSSFVSVATVLLLIHYPVFGVHWRTIGWVLMVPALALSVGSGLRRRFVFMYFIPFIPCIHSCCIFIYS